MPLDISKVEALGLEAQQVKSHQRKIKQSLADESHQFLPVIETCRHDNGGIVPLNLLRQCEAAKGVVGFVPAAGAASRYFQALRPLEKALKENRKELLSQELAKLQEQGAQSWALPQVLKTILQKDPAYVLRQRDQVCKAINQPKATLPCVEEGASFLKIKHQEHQALGLEAEVFITPPELSAEFRQHLGSNWDTTVFFEQGSDLSTLRFTYEGEPYTKKNGSYSQVPAGHGTLVKFFPQVKALFPHCHSILIRNIDNVNGTSAEVIGYTQQFLDFHQTLVSNVVSIRHYLKSGNLTEAAAVAQLLLDNMNPTLPESEVAFIQGLEYELQSLFTLQIRLFQFKPKYLSLFGEMDLAKLLKILYDRPVNTLGQVPNSGDDVGGSPVIVKVPGGQATICLEIPHASPQDRDMFLANPQQATHFNPVFVAAELFESHDPYRDDDGPFWILAHKKVGLTPVVYHETVLYELLGNSLMANAVFPAIPRVLFNPHKTVSDTAGKALGHWLH